MKPYPLRPFRWVATSNGSVLARSAEDFMQAQRAQHQRLVHREHPFLQGHGLDQPHRDAGSVEALAQPDGRRRGNRLARLIDIARWFRHRLNHLDAPAVADMC